MTKILGFFAHNKSTRQAKPSFGYFDPDKGFLVVIISLTGETALAHQLAERHYCEIVLGWRNLYRDGMEIAFSFFDGGGRHKYVFTGIAGEVAFEIKGELLIVTIKPPRFCFCVLFVNNFVLSKNMLIMPLT